MALPLLPTRLFARTLLAAFVALPLLWGCADEKKNAGGPPVPEVAVVTIEPRPVELTTELPGRTSPYLVAEIRPQVSGLLRKRLFTEGGDVKAGELLYQIDPEPFQVSLNTAKAALDKALANQPPVSARARRYKALVATEALSHQDFEDAQAASLQNMAEIESCRRQVESAEINLRYTRVTAPISGRIGKSAVTDGALLTAYQATSLATIQQLDPIYVDVTQSSADLLRLRRGLESGQVRDGGSGEREVKILLEDGSTYPLTGRLQFRDVTVDPSTGSYTVRIVVPNPKGLLLPGMFVRAVVQDGRVDQAILAPQQGVARNQKGQAVALVVNADSVVKQRILTLDRAIADHWRVVSGLSAGDRVIVEGMQKVRPGSAVKVVVSEWSPRTEHQPRLAEAKNPADKD